MINAGKAVFWTLRETYRRWRDNDGTLLAAAMAYYTALSFFPLLLVLISVFGFALRYSVGAQDAQQQLLGVLSENVSPAAAKLVSSVLSDVQTRATISGPVGLAILFIGAASIFVQLDTAFDRLWQYERGAQRRGFLESLRDVIWYRLRAFLILLALGLMVFAAFFAAMLMAGLRTWGQNLPVGHFGWQALQWMGSLAFNALVFSLLYKTIPKPPVGWREALIGGASVAVLWQLGSQLLAYFIVARDYNAYGVVGSFIALMLWTYCASCLIFLGAQLVQVLEHPEAHEPVCLP